MREAVNEITDDRWMERARRAAVVLAAVGSVWLAGGLGAGAALAATPLVVSPWAGTGAAGTPVPGAATASPLGAPSGLALDPAGNLYVADAVADEVLRITPAGALTIVAGTGSAGAPIPGPATASPLDGPTAVALDAAGNIDIADTANHVVEQVTAAGRLSVIAGTGSAGAPVAGPATASPLGGPAGLTIDGAGDLIIADGGGSTPNPYVESVSPTGTLSILAGDGATGVPVAGTATASPLRTPTGVAVDPGGNVFIADSHANLVARVTPSGTLSVYAGSSAGTAGAPRAGIAPWSRLSGPTGLATDAAGDLFIADAANNRVEEVNASDRLSVLAGNGAAGAPAYGASPTHSPLSAPTGVAQSPLGVTFIADARHGTVDRVAPAPPAASSAPAIGGTAIQGQTLSASTGAWTNAPTAYAYTWQRCDAGGANCVAIPGATAAAYTPTAADVAQTLRVSVTATNAGGSGAVGSAPSAAILPLAPGLLAAPQIGGTPTNTDTLTVGTGTWSNYPSAYTYAWQQCDASGADCTKIAGATSPSYTLQLGDVGTTIRVLVTAANAGGSTGSQTAATAVIAAATVPWVPAVAPVQRGSVTVLGTPTPGQTLTCAPGNWNGAPSFTYQWNQGTVPIAGATAQTYPVATADAGYPLSCTVTAADAGGAIEANSAPVAIAGPAAAAAGVGGAAACPAATGALGGTRLGALALGDSRAQVLRSVRVRAAGTGATDTLCLAGGPGLIVAYAGGRGASIARAGSRSGARVELLLTANAHYVLHGLRPGSTLGARRPGRPLAIGHTTWWVIARRGATGLIAVRRGVVTDVGVTSGGLAAHRGPLRRLLARFST